MIKDIQDLLIVFCSCPNRETAVAIAGSIVKQQLSPCVNIIPGMYSIYSWQGKIQNSDEVLLFIKTTLPAFKKLEELIIESHPYDCPEIIATTLTVGTSKYLAWLQTNIVTS